MGILTLNRSSRSYGATSTSPNLKLKAVNDKQEDNLLGKITQLYKDIVLPTIKEKLSEEYDYYYGSNTCFERRTRNYTNPQYSKIQKSNISSFKEVKEAADKLPRGVREKFVDGVAAIWKEQNATNGYALRSNGNSNAEKGATKTVKSNWENLYNYRADVKKSKGKTPKFENAQAKLASRSITIEKTKVRTGILGTIFSIFQSFSSFITGSLHNPEEKMGKWEKRFEVLSPQG